MTRTSDAIRAMALIGERIAARRKALGLSQSEVANAVGVSQSSVAEWEKGKNRPRVATLNKLVSTLKCGIEDILPSVSDEEAKEYRENLQQESDHMLDYLQDNFDRKQIAEMYLNTFSEITELLKKFPKAIGDDDILYYYLREVQTDGVKAIILMTDAVWTAAREDRRLDHIAIKVARQMGRLEAFLENTAGGNRSLADIDKIG